MEGKFYQILCGIHCHYSHRTSLIYHEDMAVPKCLWDDTYEENPKRFTASLNRIKQLGLHDRCLKLDSRSATRSELLLVHEEDYIEKVASTCGVDDESKLEKLSSQFDAVYFHPKTYEASLLSAGSAIEIVDSVVSGRSRNGFGLLRPPGHHAMRAEACGYCFFNNVAIAARHATENLGLERVLIIDWDVHHGQATQYTFDSDPRVLYISIHRYEHGAFWPELIESNSNWIGVGEGKGFNCNIPLNETGINDRDYLAIFHSIILPLSYRFSPQLVLVSAGYDAAIGCPEGEMLVSPASYAHFTHSLMSLADGKVCVFLEGGYCIPSLAEGAALTLRALLGDPTPDIVVLDRCRLHKTLVESVLNVIWSLKPFWPDLFPLQGSFDRSDDTSLDEQFFRPRHFPLVKYNGKMALMEKPTSYPTRNCYPVQNQEAKIKLEEEIQRLEDTTTLNDSFINKKRTAIAYHEFMTKHKSPVAHPERPSRIKETYKVLHQQELAQQCVLLNEYRAATDEEISLVHTKEHIDFVKKIKTLSNEAKKKEEDALDSVYLVNDTEEAARVSIGCLLNVVDSVMTGNVLNGFSLNRPPGHHARRNKACGFCIFNNISIAAEYAISKYCLKKVLIVDFDVHHGDGTQNTFAGREDILFISLHRYDFAEFWPSSLEAGIRNDNKNIINIPWNGTMSDPEYLSALFNIILPAAYDFHPELILVSGGFDAAVNDPLGEYQVSPELYGHLIHHLLPLTGGKCIVTLEGGYNLISLSLGVANCVSALLGLPLPSLPQTSPVDASAQETLKEVVDFHRSQWPSLTFGVDIPENNTV